MGERLKMSFSPLFYIYHLDDGQIMLIFFEKICNFIKTDCIYYWNIKILKEFIV